MVTGTFTRLNSHVLQIGLLGSDEILKPTQNHPFWSVDRQDWVPAGELHVGERLRSPSGIVQIAWIGQKPGTHRVFNIEVEDAHSYLVGDRQVWVHNVYLNKRAQKAIRSLEKRAVEHEEKLDAYKPNPDAFDNKGYLKNAPREAIREKIISTRIGKLKKEINGFRKQIEQIKNGEITYE